MVKEAKPKVDMVALEQENKILRDKIAELEKQKSDDFINVLGDSITTEIKRIRAKGQSSANTIAVVDKCDHRNISLWTRWGKRIGPLHPENAVQTLHRFADYGIVLSADRPTLEQIEAYNQSPEGQKRLSKEDNRRKEKYKSFKSGKMTEMIEAIAKLNNTTVDAIHHLIDPDKIGKKN